MSTHLIRGGPLLMDVKVENPKSMSKSGSISQHQIYFSFGVIVF